MTVRPNNGRSYRPGAGLQLPATGAPQISPLVVLSITTEYSTHRGERAVKPDPRALPKSNFCTGSCCASLVAVEPSASADLSHVTRRAGGSFGLSSVSLCSRSRCLISLCHARQALSCSPGRSNYRRPGLDLPRSGRAEGRRPTRRVRILAVGGARHAQRAFPGVPLDVHPPLAEVRAPALYGPHPLRPR